MHLGLLQCDSVDSHLQSEFGDYSDMYRRLFTSGAGGCDLTFQDYNLTLGRFPESVDECDAWLFTGSRWSAYDTHDWIVRAQVLVRELYARRRPTIGVCFGHQLVCRALGGVVTKADAGWGVGVHTATILAHRPWMVPARDTLSLLVGHQDQVTQPPAGATLLASHPFCPHDMLEIGPSMLTLQGHPEFLKGYVRAYLAQYRERIGETDYRDGIASLGQPVDSAVAGAWMLAFLRRAASDAA